MERLNTVPVHVLVVADDDGAANRASAQLRAAHLRTTRVEGTDPRSLWAVLDRLKPDCLLVDRASALAKHLPPAGRFQFADFWVPVVLFDTLADSSAPAHSAAAYRATAPCARQPQPDRRRSGRWPQG